MKYSRSIPKVALALEIILAFVSSQARSANVTSDEGNQSALETIVVTAQKRSENVQSVPITITAQTGEALKTADVRSTVDLTLVVPGLRANNQASYFQPFIRGVGGTSSLPGNESPVALYIDGLYVSFKEANIFELNNIERIEVLKGPQGTLFGRNATGGAINIITRAPGSNLEMSGDVSYGRYQDAIVNGYLSVPASDKFAVSAAVRYENTADGYQKNIVTGSELGTARSFSGMFKVRWEPTDELKINEEYIYTYRHDTLDDQITANAAVKPKGALVPGSIVSYTPLIASVNRDPMFKIHDNKNILNIRYDLDGAQFVSITGYDHADSYSQVERDRTSAPLQLADNAGFGREFTEELQLVSDNGSRLQWIGGFYFYDDREGYNPFDSAANIPGMGTPADIAAAFGKAGASFAVVNSTQFARSYAGFAESTYGLTDSTHVTAGFRYTTEDRRLKGDRKLITAPPPGNVLIATPTSTVDLSTNFSKPTWRLAVDHQLTPSTMIFASYNRGFRSGAYNPTSISQTQIPLAPEVIDAYEAGFKGQWLDNRLRLNTSIFYYDYRNLHVSVRAPDTGLIRQQNAGGAEIYGLDMDFAARPLAGLTVSGGLNLSHARYTDFANASTFAIDPVKGGGVAITIPNAKGQPLSYAPDFTANLGLQYQVPLQNGSQVELAGNYFYTSDYSRQVGNIFGREEVQAYSSLNTSITWRPASESYFVRAWGRNVTNHVVLGSTLDSFAYFYVIQRPATYGLTIGFCLNGLC